MSKLQPVGAHEPCPCGSGKEYIDCCLDRKFRYVKDEQGKVTKLESNMSSVLKNRDPSGSIEDAIMKDTEVNPLVVLEICEHGHLNCHTYVQLDLDKVDVADLKSICSYIERQKARVTLALARGGTRELDSENSIPLIVLLMHKEGYLVSMGGASVEDIVGLPEEDLLSTIDCMEDLRMNLMGIVLHKLVDQFMFPDGHGDEDNSEGPPIKGE